MSQDTRLECGKCGRRFALETDYYNHYDNYCSRKQNLSNVRGE